MYVESAPNTDPDAERVMSKWLCKVYDIIFGTSFGYMDAMRKVAEEYQM